MRCAQHRHWWWSGYVPQPCAHLIPRVLRSSSFRIACPHHCERLRSRACVAGIRVDANKDDVASAEMGVVTADGATGVVTAKVASGVAGGGPAIGSTAAKDEMGEHEMCATSARGGRATCRNHARTLS